MAKRIGSLRARRRSSRFAFAPFTARRGHAAHYWGRPSAPVAPPSAFLVIEPYRTPVEDWFFAEAALEDT
jgi:hypothetical protein